MNSYSTASSFKRCLACGYILNGLPAPRCPECGREFDPADPRTFDDGSRFPRSPWVMATVGMILVAAGISGYILFPWVRAMRLDLWYVAAAMIGWLIAARSLSISVEYVRDPRSSQRGRATAVIVLDAAILLPLGLLMAFIAIRLLLEWLRCPV